MSRSNLVRETWIRLPAPQDWSADGKVPITLSPLASGCAGMSAPVIRDMYYRLTGSRTTGAAQGDMAFWCHHIKKFRLRDGADQRIDVEGATLHKILHREFAGTYLEGDSVAPGTVADQFDEFVPIPLYPAKSIRRADYGIPVGEFVKGGELKIEFNGATFGPANSWTINSGTIEIWCLVADEGRREAKSRLTYFDAPLQLADTDYPVNGVCRWLDFYVGSVAEIAGTTFNHPSITFDIPLLEYSTFPATLLRRYYMDNNPIRFDNFTTERSDPTAAGFVIPIIPLTHKRATTEMPVLGDLHIRINGFTVDTSKEPRVIRSVVIPRDPNLTAQTLQFRSIGEMAQNESALAVNAADGRDQSVKGKPPEVQARMAAMPLKRSISKGK